MPNLDHGTIVVADDLRTPTIHGGTLPDGSVILTGDDPDDPRLTRQIVVSAMDAIYLMEWLSGVTA